MKILRESKDFEVAVGQVWWKNGFEHVTVRHVEDNEVCISEYDGLNVCDVGVFQHEFTIHKHQGTIIDLETYEYAYASDPADGFKWVTNNLYRRPKAQEKPSEPEKPYVDCGIYEKGEYMYIELDGCEYGLECVTGHTAFIGFVFADGQVSCASPWHCIISRTKQAERASHVRFKREV